MPDRGLEEFLEVGTVFFISRKSAKADYAESQTHLEATFYGILKWRYSRRLSGSS